MGVFEQVVLSVILAALGYLTGYRVKKQDSGWERLIKASQDQIGNQQATISALSDKLSRAQQMLHTCRREATLCPRPHPTVERWDTGELRLDDVDDR